MNPKLAAQTICEALVVEPNDFELAWVEWIVRSVLPSQEEVTPVPGPLPRVGTHRRFPPPMENVPISDVFQPGDLCKRTK